MENAVLAIIQHQKRAGDLHFHALLSPALPWEVHEEADVCRQVGLRGDALLAVDGFPAAFQNGWDFQLLCLHGQLPSRAVGVLRQRQHFPVGDEILPYNAAFQAHMSLVVHFQLQAGGT